MQKVCTSPLFPLSSWPPMIGTRQTALSSSPPPSLLSRAGNLLTLTFFDWWLVVGIAPEWVQTSWKSDGKNSLEMFSDFLNTASLSSPHFFFWGVITLFPCPFCFQQNPSTLALPTRILSVLLGEGIHMLVLCVSLICLAVMGAFYEVTRGVLVVSFVVLYALTAGVLASFFDLSLSLLLSHTHTLSLSLSVLLSHKLSLTHTHTHTHSLSPSAGGTKLPSPTSVCTNQLFTGVGGYVSSSLHKQLSDGLTTNWVRTCLLSFGVFTIPVFVIW